MDNKEKKYYLGLDIGTNSVGFAVTNQDYHLVRRQGKHLWGSRLFEEASDASERRIKRNGRRRYQRRRQRILLLQEIFNDEMKKEDPNFFDRLNNSALLTEDKPDECKTSYLLFNETDYTDKEFNRKYPTIYHLRKAMIDNPDKKFRLKEIYLVIAHMIKYRGNFLRQADLNGDVGKDTGELVELFNELDEAIISNADVDDTPSLFGIDKDIASNLINVFQQSLGITALKDEILKHIKVDNNQKKLIEAICGSKKKVSDFFPEYKEINEEIGKVSLDFGSEDFEQNIESLSNDEKDIILAAKNIYDFRVLTNLLKGKGSLSEAMVEVYNTHHEQLKVLRKLMKHYNKEEYDNFFINLYGKDGKPVENYANYVGMTIVDGKRYRVKHSTSHDALVAQIRKLLPFDKLKDENFQWIGNDKALMLELQKQLEASDYLPRQNSKENGVFPYQLNKNELVKIIDNQKKYYPFLGEMDKDYLDPSKESYKIVSLLEYKIPYFVGPLSNKTGDGKNHWMVRKADGKITPWNFHDLVDENETAEGFIERMKNPCTYLIGETTLPKSSLLYSEFMLLNELNNWKINGFDITKEDKLYLIENVYLKSQKTPTLKELKSALKSLYKEDVKLTTKRDNDLQAEDIHANLKPFVEMERVLGGNAFKDLYEDFDSDKRKLAEKIIFTITMFEDADLKQKKLKELGLNETQLKTALGLKYKGWGNLSEKVLDGLKTEQENSETGEIFNCSIIDIMRHKPENFMQILSSENGYTFKKQIDDIREETIKNEGMTKEDLVDESYISPAMKRSTRQSLKIVDELKKILHIDHFDSIFVECTRHDADKKRTQSRKKKIDDIYKSAKGFVDDQLKDQLSKKTDDQLRSKKMYLYFMQLGKSVYTGQTIDLKDLDKKYDIDHIIPQAKVKDDSFLNTVLVEKEINNKKQDEYPIPQSIITEAGRKHILYLAQNQNLMPAAKKDRLLRPITKPLTDDEMTGFINRQLTMTDQSIKAVCDILRNTESGTKIVFSKAENVSEFRHVFGLVKCREINDFHHANDAYLNIVVGNVYNKVYSSQFNVDFYRKHIKEINASTKLDAKNFFTRDEYVTNITNSGRCVWKAKQYYDKKTLKEIPESEGTIDLVRKTLSWNDPMVTQMLFTQKGQHGFFNKISLHTAKEGSAAYPLKLKKPYDSKGWEEKYGGYGDLTAPYFMLVVSDGKKNIKQFSLENVPSIYLASFKSNDEKEKFLTNNLGLKNPKIIIDKLLIRTVIEFPHENGNVRLGISGKSNDSICFINLSEPNLLSYNSLCYFKAITKVIKLQNSKKKDDNSSLENENEIISGSVKLTKENNIKLFDEICDKYYSKDEFIKMPGLGKKMIAICSKKAQFNDLSLLDQMKFLAEMISLSNCKSPSADLTLLGLKKLGSVYLSTSKNLPLPFRIIKQSTTGFYEKVIFDSEKPEEYKRN